MKHRTLVAFLALAALAAFAPDASAGAKGPWEVYVDPTFQSANGSPGTARNSADGLQYIYCFTSAIASYTYGYCGAQTAAGVSASCWTTQPQLIQAIHGMASDGGIAFTWDANGECNNIVSYKGSVYETKQP